MEIFETQRTKKVNKDRILYRKIETNITAICLGGLCLELERVGKIGRRDDGAGRKDNTGLVQLLPGCMCALDKKKPADRRRTEPYRTNRRNLRKQSEIQQRPPNPSPMGFRGA